jgi:hypothetical protein
MELRSGRIVSINECIYTQIKDLLNKQSHAPTRDTRIKVTIQLYKFLLRNECIENLTKNYKLLRESRNAALRMLFELREKDYNSPHPFTVKEQKLVDLFVSFLNRTII